MPSIDQILAATSAFGEHRYILFFAIVAGSVVAMTKGGWFTTWVAIHVPAWARPYLALAVAIAGTASTEIKAGVDWKRALIDGLYAAALAVLGHQTVVEGMRGGREVMPTAPWHKPENDKDRNPGSGPPAPPIAA